jgi:uncharacterized cupredoxin-like copper-binding protein
MDWCTGFMVCRRWALLVAVGALLAGCATASTPTGSPMNGGGAGMMNADPAYTFARLSCSVPTAMPGAIVNVMLGDMGMTQMMSGTAPLGAPMMLRAAPTTVSAGQVSLVVSNMGWRTHELVILPLPAGAAAGARVPGRDGKVDETGSVGEVSNNCAEGEGDGITSGAVGWTTVTLTPGHYELVCNLQNHYANGMHESFVVT